MSFLSVPEIPQVQLNPSVSYSSAQTDVQVLTSFSTIGDVSCLSSLSLALWSLLSPEVTSCVFVF